MENAAKIEVGYGTSKEPDAFAAGRCAAQQAVAGIATHPLSVVLVFASVRHDLEALLRGIRGVVGEVPVLGATTAGEICDGSQQESVVVVALASAYLHVHVGVGEGVSEDWQQAVNQAVSAPGVRPFFSSQNGTPWSELTRQGKAAFTLLFSPGNTRRADSRSYEILEELKRLSQGLLPIFGGSSADDWRMEENFVLLGQRAYPDSVLVAVFETHLRFGIGLAHGFRPGPQRATITRAQGHEVLELDHEPAARIYARMLNSSPEALAGRHLTLATGQPVGIPDPYGQYSISVASYFTHGGGVRFSQPVPEGTVLTIMEAEQNDLIAAGCEALRKALLRGGIVGPAVALVCSCALRTHILGDRTDEEIVDMKKLLVSAPLVGFYSFGEQGLADDGVNRHNNEVITVLVLGQALSHAAQVALENERLRERMRENEERLSLALEAATDGLFDWHMQTGETYFSPRYYTMLGYEPDELPASYETWVDLLHPDDRSRALGVVNEIVERKKDSSEIEFRMRTKSGEWQHILSRGQVTERDSSGRPLRLVGTHVDITTRKQTEEALRKSETLLRTIAANYPAYLSIIEKDLTIGFTSGIEFARQGLDPDDFVGSTLEQVFGEQAPKVKENYTRAFAGEAVSFELYINDQYQLYNVVPLRDETGEVQRILTVVQNITERKAAEATLRRREQEFKTLVENTPDMITRFDRERRHIYVNPAVEKELGAPPQMLLGKTHRELGMSDELADRLETAIRQVLETGQDQTFETSIPGDDGVKYYLSRGVPEFAEDGSIESALFIHRNVTARKQVEKEREKLIRELEDSLARVKTLSGLLPICASCKKIRDDRGYWTQVEVYVRDHSEVEFTHGLCPECIKKLYPNYRDDNHPENQGEEETQT